jgi:hypothetical protein
MPSVELKAIFSGDTKALTAAVADAKGKVNSLGTVGNSAAGIQNASVATKKFAANLDKAKASAGGLRDSVMGAMGPMLGLAGITLGTRFIIGAAQYADSLQDISKRTGLTGENVQKLAYAAKLSGSSFEGVEKGFKRLQAIVGGSELTALQAKALARLGFSLEYLKTLKPDELFEKVALAIGKVPDPTQRAGLAIELMGRSGTEMLPMIKDMQALGEQAEKLGVIMSSADLENASRFMDKLDSLKMRSQAAGGRFLYDITHMFQSRENEAGTDKTAYETTGQGAQTAALRRFREAKTAEAARAAKKEQESSVTAQTEQAKINAANAAQEKKFADADAKAKGNKLAEEKKYAEATAKQIMDAAKKLADARKKLAEARKEKADAATIKKGDAEVKAADDAVTAAEKKLKAIQARISAASNASLDQHIKIGKSARGVWQGTRTDSALRSESIAAEKALAAAQGAKASASARLDAARNSIQSNKSESSLAIIAKQAMYWQQTLQVLQQRLPGAA